MEEAYKNYLKNWEPQKIETDEDPMYWMDQKLVNNRALPQDVFIHCIKTDDKFAKAWGVIVEVRELSLEERYMLVRKNYLCPKWDFVLDEKGNPVTNPIPQDVWYDNYNIPRRAISLTYNNQTIENYE